MIARWQLLALGLNSDWILHRMEVGRLHPVFRGVYAVGRPQVSQYGMWRAATLACGDAAAIGDDSAAALWGIRRSVDGPIHVVVPNGNDRRHPGIRVHRRATLTASDVTTRHGIPVTTPTATLIDLAARHPRNELEAALNEADVRGLIEIEALRDALAATAPRPGVAKLRITIDRRTFTFTRSQLERHFLPIARRAGLSRPLTRVYVNGYEVDFYWPDLGLVVETDGGTYHRTPAQQAADRRRDQTHTAAGLTPIRFTHGQIRYEPSYAEEIVRAVGLRLARA